MNRLRGPVLGYMMDPIEEMSGHTTDNNLEFSNSVQDHQDKQFNQNYVLSKGSNYK